MSNRILDDRADVIYPPGYPPASVGRTITAIKYVIATAGGLFLGLIVGLVIALSNNLVTLC